jgi:Mrp family chromosome partitioning ATPase
VLPRGVLAGDDALDVAEAADILSTLQSQADLVVVSTGALHLSAGALAWAQAGDSAIVVASRDRSRRDDVTYAVESLRLVGADVAGAVLAERRRGIRRAGGTAAPSPTSEASAYPDPTHRRPDSVPARLGTEPVLEFEEITRPSPATGSRPRRRRGPSDGTD